MSRPLPPIGLKTLNPAQLPGESLGACQERPVAVLRDARTRLAAVVRAVQNRLVLPSWATQARDRAAQALGPTLGGLLLGGSFYSAAAAAAPLVPVYPGSPNVELVTQVTRTLCDTGAPAVLVLGAAALAYGTRRLVNNEELMARLRGEVSPSVAEKVALMTEGKKVDAEDVIHLADLLARGKTKEAAVYANSLPSANPTARTVGLEDSPTETLPAVGLVDDATAGRLTGIADDAEHLLVLLHLTGSAAGNVLAPFMTQARAMATTRLGFSSTLLQVMEIQLKPLREIENLLNSIQSFSLRDDFDSTTPAHKVVAELETQAKNILKDLNDDHDLKPAMLVLASYLSALKGVCLVQFELSQRLYVGGDPKKSQALAESRRLINNLQHALQSVCADPLRWTSPPDTNLLLLLKATINKIKTFAGVSDGNTLQGDESNMTDQLRKIQQDLFGDTYPDTLHQVEGGREMLVDGFLTAHVTVSDSVIMFKKIGPYQKQYITLDLGAGKLLITSTLEDDKPPKVVQTLPLLNLLKDATRITYTAEANTSTHKAPAVKVTGAGSGQLAENCIHRFSFVFDTGEVVLSLLPMADGLILIEFEQLKTRGKSAPAQRKINAQARELRNALLPREPFLDAHLDHQRESTLSARIQTDLNNMKSSTPNVGARPFLKALKDFGRGLHYYSSSDDAWIKWGPRYQQIVQRFSTTLEANEAQLGSLTTQDLGLPFVNKNLPLAEYLERVKAWLAKEEISRVLTISKGEIEFYAKEEEEEEEEEEDRSLTEAISQIERALKINDEVYKLLRGKTMPNLQMVNGWLAELNAMHAALNQQIEEDDDSGQSAHQADPERELPKQIQKLIKHIEKNFIPVQAQPPTAGGQTPTL